MSKATAVNSLTDRTAKQLRPPFRAGVVAGADWRALPSGVCEAAPGIATPPPLGGGGEACHILAPPPAGDEGGAFEDPFWGQLEGGVAELLREAGVEDARDLASLSMAGLTNILGQEPGEDVLRLREQG